MDGFNRWALALPRFVKQALAVTVDAALCLLSVALAVYLRVDRFPTLSTGFVLTATLSVGVALPVFYILGVYRTMVRHADWSAMIRYGQAALLAGIPVAAAVTFVGVPDIPRTVGIIQPLLLLLLVGTSRMAVRMVLERGALRRTGQQARTGVVIYGAGSAGRQLCSALAKGSGLETVAYVDDDPTLQGRTLNAVPILSPHVIDRLVEDGKITEVLLAMPSASRSRRAKIIEHLRALPVRVQTLPALSDLARGRVSINDLRELDVEDLLGREPVAPNELLLAKTIADKVVLVTGAGGSIGSELCRQILAIRPQRLLLVEVSEFALYSVYEDLKRRLDDTDDHSVIVPLLASVADPAQMRDIIGTYHPDTIYHAAAYKHVPLVEQNVVVGVRNNVWGTLTIARTAIAHDVADFVLISTDKAVRPTNVMGASKRLSEMCLQALSGQGRTRFSMVRFGNVLGSSGSVVPLFRRQIRQGGPVTITHRDITRYFMTIPEAAQLVIQAGAMASSGEVFVLDMGEPVRIYELACNMIQLSGASVRDADNPDGDIEIEIVGLRPAEKLYEELLVSDNAQPTRHVRIFQARDDVVPWPVLALQLDELGRALDGGDADTVRQLLEQLVPGYRPAGQSPTGLIASVEPVMARPGLAYR